VPYENLKTIASDDVESVSVLKDQAAVSTYGEKAKDGVIIFTMKKK
jgi:TonB-dependent SusC/RagA subfamily outer membrane receptor